MEIDASGHITWYFAPGVFNPLGDGFSRNPPDRDAMRALVEGKEYQPTTLREAFALTQARYRFVTAEELQELLKDNKEPTVEKPDPPDLTVEVEHLQDKAEMIPSRTFYQPDPSLQRRLTGHSKVTHGYRWERVDRGAKTYVVAGSTGPPWGLVCARSTRDVRRSSGTRRRSTRAPPPFARATSCSRWRLTPARESPR